MRGVRRIAWPATFASKGAARLQTQHLRFRPERSGQKALHCFLLDCSGSMLGGRRLALAKGVLASLFDRIGQARDEAALICFSGSRAESRFGPAVPRWWNERWLRPLGGGGGTPLSSGVRSARQLLASAATGQVTRQRCLWILTDGRSLDQPPFPAEADRIVLVDFETGALRLARCKALAESWGALYLRPEDLPGQD